MTLDPSPTPEDIEQHEIAEAILLGLLESVIDYPGSFDREGAAVALRMAAEERERQGDYRASVLLEEWAERLRGRE
ncbi:hypothetical protein [Paracoccus versutus]|uniref:Uncharacterized protein n=1 Tax=Paracoccus versutus TaxID=34007 RepID=A0A3D9XGR3_PARVE|nr:hypothetical protein [Paracoccus versutus]REF69624.1 hypothetical protein BDD41_2334 [Paracoccus versutus]WGR58001.1 hypothetical protein E3U25_18870 [Paracoccus versutus]